MGFAVGRSGERGGERRKWRGLRGEWRERKMERGRGENEREKERERRDSGGREGRQGRERRERGVHSDVQALAWEAGRLEIPQTEPGRLQRSTFVENQL